MISREDFEEMKQWASEQTGWLDQTEMKGFFSVYEDEHKIESKDSCGECEWYEGDSVSLYNCKELETWIRPDFFCANFTRKEQ